VSAGAVSGATIEQGREMGLRFEWDPRKATENLKKHGVSFEEALSAFADPLARIFEDEKHSGEEPREILVGHSREERLILVCFTERPGALRLISARPATRKERQNHEKNTTRQV
jgi:uncharacterized DUF497 family protein